MRPGLESKTGIAGPVLVTLVGLLLFLVPVLVSAGGDPLAFARIGERYQAEGAADPEGYDGQFVYFIARDPDPQRVAPYLDVPAYRYQRILLPLLARLLSAGWDEALPWALLAIGLASQLSGVAIVAILLRRVGAGVWFSLVYGLWAGLLLAVRLDLPEPLAYALVAAAILIGEDRPLLKWTAFALAVFAKEVTLLFVAGQLLAYALDRQWKSFLGLSAVAVLPFALFQGWLVNQFGAAGLGSGGAMTTGFEVVPFFGLVRISAFGLLPLLVFAVIVIPFFYFPSIWGLMRSVRALFERRDVLSSSAGFLFVNALAIPFLPFSTVREPGGLFRFGSGLVLAVLLFAARWPSKKALRYSLIWLSLNAILINSVR